MKRSIIPTFLARHESLGLPRLRQAAIPLAATERTDSAVIDESNELDTEFMSPLEVLLMKICANFKFCAFNKFLYRGTKIQCLTDFVNGGTINSLD